MRLFRIILSIVFLVQINLISAQETYPVNGPRNAVHSYHAFTNVNIFDAESGVIKNTTVLIRDEKIVGIGSEVSIPKQAIVHDLNGKWIYPSFIELDGEYGLKKDVKKPAQPRRYSKPQFNSKKVGAYSWNEAVKPEINAADDFKANQSSAKEWRAKGVATVLTHKHDGIFRGTSCLVLTGDESENIMVYRPRAANHYSFSKGSSRQTYPSSLMGSIALMRQTFYDARWYANSEERVEVNFSLKAINDNQDLPNILEVYDYLTALRGDKISDEFELEMILRGNGDEYHRIDEISKTNASLIVPMKFPVPYEVDNAYEALDLSLRRMKEWELAPYNAAMLSEADVDFALTTSGLKSKELWSGIRKLKKCGMSETDIISALTVTPARLIKVDEEMGRVQKGYVANFFISSDNIFEKGSVIREHWVNGKQYVLDAEEIDIRGTYNLNLNRNGGKQLEVSGTVDEIKATLISGKEKTPVHISLSGHEVKMRYAVKEKKGQYVLLSGQVNDEDSRIWIGKAQLPNGKWVDWAAIKQEEFSSKDTSKTEKDSMILPEINYPLGAYGFDSLPETETVIFKHATLWTNEDTGIVENMDICIQDGKILAIGKSLSKVGLFGTKEIDVEVVEAKGKHITSGIIDEHSHIAISRGVNESGQSSSAEVSIADVINPDDINIYRQLAGGVTAAQLLHGSANPIGGQSGLIKFRWGRGAEEMKIAGADPFIKFALGENVKQSNWGDLQRTRYPQTRMGVEQVYYDAFMRAREYKEIWTIYESGLKNKRNKKNPPVEPRRDLELECLAQILDSARFITCHSYVQSEINMLMHVADSMRFRVNTFTHILEGYKVADKMKAHGVGGSTFSDWWAYKYEVNDAIPYNATLLNEHGIVTAINSDDAEMGRRLNQEASKAVKYGNTSEEDAWKMVTLNPAKLLHLDDRMGSLKEGKDADIVLWSDHPMSINAKAERTYVDGIRYFDMERDQKMRTDIEQKRSRLIQKMIDSKSKNGKSKKIDAKKEKHYHCDSLEDEVKGDI